MGDVARAADRDAVIVLPGIMGSELVDVHEQRVLWGLADIAWYVRAWTTGGGLDALAVTDDERAGRVGRVRATRVLRVPAFAPMLRGVEPYTALLDGVRRAVPHPDAVLEFPYDWRLSVPVNAAALADAADAHLRRWRAHRQGSRSARLVLVAHSMGGMVARWFTEQLHGGAETRSTVTLGTPFFGAAKAALILSAGRGAPLPLPRARLRRLVARMPGLYALLPTYRCVDEGTTARALTPSDVAGLGGDADLAREAMATQTVLRADGGRGLRALVGVEQPTAQSLVLADGIAEGRQYTCMPGDDGPMARVDRGGDGTVYREAAAPVGAEPVYLPQTHTAIAKTREAVAHLRAVLTETPLGPPLGGAAIGLTLPDVVAGGAPFEVGVSGADPAVVACRVTDAATGALVARPVVALRGGRLSATVTLPAPGVYRVELDGGGASPVSDLVMAAPAEDLGEGVR